MAWINEVGTAANILLAYKDNAQKETPDRQTLLTGDYWCWAFKTKKNQKKKKNIFLFVRK